MKCRICGGGLKLLGSIPFDKNNAMVNIVDDTPMEYHQCKNCLAVSCQEMLDWTPEKLGEKCYNSEYVKYDPDYMDERPRNYAYTLLEIFGEFKYNHLDYGSGSGKMAEILRSKGWDSLSYDPYSENIKPIGKFKLVTAIEVIEHTLNLDKTIKDIKQYLHRDGVLIFSTKLADKNTTIDWWYIGTRGGHINIQSEKSLKLVAKANSMEFSSIGEGIHIMQRTKSNMFRIRI